jgi:spore germination protein YaaH
VKQLPGGRRSVAVALAFVLASCGTPPSPTPSPSVTSASPSSAVPSASSDGVDVSPSPVPAPGHELYGFVPYWEMDDTIAAHLATTPLTTLGLFSVTNTGKGAINTTQNGYLKITGPIGAAMIAAAHKRGTRVELVFTSFGASRNRKFFANAGLQAATVKSLVALVGQLGIDGVDVDVEGLDIGSAPAFGAFVGQLRAALVAADRADTVSVATGAGPTGAAMAGAAVAAGADRVFLMAYDYRTATSQPGATSPVARADDGRSVSWSLDLYAAAGIPPGRLLLGLPLYGVVWPVAGPVIGAPATGDGQSWVLRHHVDLLTNPGAAPEVDPLEVVSVYFLGSDGSVGAPSLDPSLPPAASDVRWTAIYVDTPDTLTTKLGLGESRGLAGAGFWAIGYERGLPAYTDLMTQYVAGKVPAS